MRFNYYSLELSHYILMK